MKDHATTERRKGLTGPWGLALSACLFGFLASPSMALSMTGTHTDIVGSSLGTTGIPGLVAGLGGSPGSGPVGDFPNVTTPGNIAAFSNTAPVTFSLPGDAFPFIDGKLGLDDDGVKTIGAPVAIAFALGTKHRPDLFFADGHVRQSGPSPASLLLFGATLVGLGLVVRRRMRGAAPSSV